MLGKLVHNAARPIVQVWSRESTRSWRAMPVPVDAPLVHATGPDPDRILLIGSGPAVSYGVLSYNLGLAGQLARVISGFTHRGVSVQAKVSPDIGMAEAATIVENLGASPFDAIVVMTGGLEAMSFYPVRAWREQVERLIASSPVPVFIIGNAPLSTYVRLSGLTASLTTRHAAALNRQSEAATLAHVEATFIPFQPIPLDLVSAAGRQTYADFANLIAGPIADMLNSRCDVITAPAPFDEDARQRALDDLGILDIQDDYELRRIVETVRDLFGAVGAAIHLIDHERQHVLAAAGMSTADRPRDESLCNEMIVSGVPLVIEDGTTDPFYGTPEWLARAGAARFYAGYPLEAPDGHRIGALCIIDVAPREFGTADRALLRDMSLHVQRVLWQKAV